MRPCSKCGATLAPGVIECPRCKHISSDADCEDQVQQAFPEGDATRLLSAACYLNPLFRVSIYDLFVRNRYNAVAPDYGIHLPTLLRHCLYSRRRAFRRSMVISLIPAYLGYRFLDRSLDTQDLWISALTVLTISLIYKWSTFSMICRRFSREALDSSFVPPLPRNLEHLEKSEGNLVVYSGFSPFVGAGTRMGGWSFATDTRRGKPLAEGLTGSPKSFTVAGLYDAISNSLHGLCLSGLVIEDRIYVSGQDVRHDSRFFDELKLRPKTSVSRSVMEGFIDPKAVAPARHYRCVRVVRWDGELVVSFLFRVVLTTHSLYVEANSHLLTPVDDLYRQLEHVHRSKTFLQFILRLVGSVLSAIPFLVWAPLNLIHQLVKPIVEFITGVFEDWLVSERPTHDFGAASSARELASSFYAYRRYAVRQDGDMISKVLEKCVIDSVIDFLDEHEIDTTGVRDRETTILSNGVFISGGTIQAGSVAIGKGASAGRLVRRFVPRSKVKAASAA